jgi:hypothetical protein
VLKVGEPTSLVIYNDLRISPRIAKHSGRGCTIHGLLFLLLIKEISKRDDLHERSMTLIVFLFSAFSCGIGVLGGILQGLGKDS